MKVLRVIVDEMPINCLNCNFNDKQVYSDGLMIQYKCLSTGTYLSKSSSPMNTFSCPLEVETDGWIPVSERLPEDGVEVLGYFEHGEYWKWDIVAYFSNRNVWTADDHVLRNDAITHWRPLPEPPEVTNE